MQQYTLIGIITVLFVLIQLIRNVGKTLPIIDLTLFLAGVQWIIGPYIDYVTIVKHFKYFMYVSEIEYMSIVVPMYIALVLPYYTLKKKYPIKLEIKQLNKIGLWLMVLGVIGLLLTEFVPSSLSFIFFLLQNTLYVGAGVILFQKKSSHKKWAYLAIIWLVYSAISSGFFHGLILWSMFLFFLLGIKLKIKWYQTFLVFLIGFFTLSLIQSIKLDFRSKLAKTNNPIELFTELVLESYNDGITENEKDVNEINVRLNQGWIISAIIKHTPKKEPHANGATINEAIWASLLPRFLNPNKKKAGGRENFIKYTGLPLGKNTSMGLSIVGEAYANYGKNGGIIFMLFWSIFLTLFYNFLMKLAQKNNIILFFIPLIFLQVVKAETELVVVLNHLIKSSIISYVLIWYLQSKIKQPSHA